MAKKIKCPKCLDTGWRQYDWNHKQVCEYCCLHESGWFAVVETQQGYEKGKNNKCCKAGCGTMYRDIQKIGKKKKLTLGQAVLKGLKEALIKTHIKCKDPYHLGWSVSSHAFDRCPQCGIK